MDENKADTLIVMAMLAMARLEQMKEVADTECMLAEQLEKGRGKRGGNDTV